MFNASNRAERRRRFARVLVVENDFVIALDLGQQLADSGFEVVGPARSVSRALKFVDDPGCDCAVLNFNLEGETSVPIAQKLRASSKPFVVLSGYPKDYLGALFNGTTILTKPISTANLVAAVRECVDVMPNAGSLANL